NFHRAAYLADDRNDLLSAINEFLDSSIVVPPSDVPGEELLLSVAQFQRKMLKKRQAKEDKVLAKEVKSLEERVIETSHWDPGTVNTSLVSPHCYPWRDLPTPVNILA
ncbi:hypothetical protein scyTo_0024597, partial [Scyliorhinus torazame]|nr:hypothetical protein [Scyliorhinus torazame]